MFFFLFSLVLPSSLPESGKISRKTFLTLCLPSFLPSICLPFVALQDQIEPKMDEVADDSSDFICHRAKEADTQAGRLVSQALLHQTNTGDSSRSATSLNVLSWLKFICCLKKWANILKKPFQFVFRKLSRTPALRDPIRTKSCGGENGSQSHLARSSIRTRTFISIG